MAFLNHNGLNVLLSFLRDQIDKFDLNIRSDYSAKLTTYDELVNTQQIRDLVRGTMYIMTDYKTTTTQVNTTSTEEIFCLALMAITEDRLSPTALLFKPYDYTAPSCIVWYSILNDSEKYAWADTENGKGVIYRMIDELGNDCPYDFLSIMVKNPMNTSEENWYKTFNDGCRNNIIKPYVEGAQLINCIVFCNDAYGNTFDINCHDMIIGTGKSKIISSNTFGADCYNNSFAECYLNTFGSRCYNNTIEGLFYGNSIGENFHDNVIHGSFYNNQIAQHFYDNDINDKFNCNNVGIYCYNNAINTSCAINTFGSNFGYNIIGTSMNSCVIGNNFQHNNVGDGMTAVNIGNSCGYNNICNAFKASKIDSGVRYCHITSETDDGQIQYYHITGMSGNAQSPIKLNVVHNQSWETKISRNSKGEIKTYCEADLID